MALSPLIPARRDPAVQEIIAKHLNDLVPTVDSYRGLTMPELDHLLRRQIYDACRDTLGKSAAGTNRQNFAALWKNPAAETLTRRFDSEPIAMVCTGEGQRKYLYDYVVYGPNPFARSGSALLACRAITRGMYGQPAWMKDLAEDLNSRAPRLPWKTLEVVHQSGTKTYRLVSPALPTKKAPQR